MTTFTLPQIKAWTSPSLFEEGARWFENDRVQELREENGAFQGKIMVRDRAQICRFSVTPQGEVSNNCPCRTNRMEGLICGHVIAIALVWHREHADPLMEREQRILEKMKLGTKRLRSGLIKRGPGGIPAVLHLGLRQSWQSEAEQDRIQVIPEIEVNGRRQRPNQLHPTQVLGLSFEDEKLLCLLEELTGGPLPPVFPVSRQDFVQILEWSLPGNLTIHGWPDPLKLHPEALMPMLTVELDPVTGELLLQQDVEFPIKLATGSAPFWVLSERRGWVTAGGHAWPLEAVPPKELQGLYAGRERISRQRVFSFLYKVLPELEERMLVDNRVDVDQFERAPVAPGFALRLKGGGDYCSGTLHAVYGDMDVLAASGQAPHPIGQPDPANPLAYGDRNSAAEAEALALLASAGFSGRSGDALGTLEGRAQIMNLLARCRYELEPLGWTIQATGQLEQLLASTSGLLATVGLAESEAPDWFKLRVNLLSETGESLSEARIRKALERGEQFIDMDGTTILIPLQQSELLIQAIQEAEPDADGGLRVSEHKAGYLQALLASAEGLPVQATPRWQALAAEQNQETALEAVVLPDSLVQTLRPYQDYGVRWLRFMERAGTSGILADEMGLGKTLQTLCWLQMERSREGAQGLPSLLVCPSSLVENWVEEAQRFTPDLKVLALSGSKRASLWNQVPDQGLVVVSYGIMRRDLKDAEAQPWAVVALDEAQHIKNPGTQNAKAAKKLKADQKLVLTGTPMENSVFDLWSLMDFLMPGYLGTHAAFRKRFEAPLRTGGPGSASLMRRLRQKIHPFLLRRLKADVAKDLPPKIQRLVYCDLAPKQRVLYEALEAQVQADAKAAVAGQGFGASRMNVLQGLMRLRQACCHPQLLPDDAAKEIESGKLMMFLELLDEIMDGGHRVLVFSQFVSMLSILRKALEEREIAYRYLDGSTKNRMEEVHAFQDHEDVPVFLISLMAGGTGLNLTGADVVIHFDPWWNPAVEDQATDRAHRIGQENTVYAMKLVSRNTIESRVIALQQKKRDLIDAALTKDEAIIERLSWEDVQDLLAL